MREQMVVSRQGRPAPGWRGLAVLAVLTGVLVAGCSDPEVRKKEYYDRGVALAAEQNYAEAILEFRNALKQDPRYGEARLALADAFAARGDGRQSAREYIRAAELLPESAEAQRKAAFVLLRGGEFERARKLAEASLAQEKTIDALIILANAQAGLKQPDDAMASLEDAIQLAPDDPRGYTSLGTLEAVQGDKVEAEASYRRAVGVDPKALAPRLALAYFYWSDNRVADAEPELNAAREIAPDDPLTNRMLALFYLTQRRPAEAEAPLKKLAAANDTNGTLTLGDLYVAQDKPDQARPLYESLKAKTDARSTAVARLAALDYAAGRTDAAHATLNEALSTLPNDVPLLTLKSRWLAREGKLDEAVANARKAVAVDANAANAQYALGVALAARGETEEATKAFTETLRINPQASLAQIGMSRMLLAKGDPAGALGHAQAARKAQPTSPEARLEVARALMAGREFNRAATELQPLVKQYPESAEVHALYGTLLGARNDVAGASRELDRALAIDPTHGIALSNRLILDLRAKQPDAARARIATALAKAPANAGLLVIAGRFEAMAGHPDQAEAHLRKSIEIDPANLEGYTALGQLYLSQRKLDAARTEFERLAERRPNAIAARTLVGMILQLQNREDDAVKSYEQAVAAGGNAGVAANNLAYIYASRGQQLDRALELAQQATRSLPDRPDVTDTLGWVYLKRDLPALAIPPFEEAVEKAPGNPLFHYHLGLAYAAADRPADARRALEAALKLQSDFDGADDARARLGKGKS